MTAQATKPESDPRGDAWNPAAEESPGFSTDDVFTMDEAARLKGVSYHTVSRAVRSGKLNARRMGRMALMTAEDLAAWQPMRERAPLKYRQRKPAPHTSPGVVDLASGERVELARRLSALYEAIHGSALQQPLRAFTHMLADRFARGMEFDRVAIWLINEARTEVELIASVGAWYGPDVTNPPVSAPFDPELMYLTKPDVTDGIACWTSPAPDNLGPAFSAPLVASQKHIGYIIGDRNGAPFSLTDAQIQLGQSLATQAALTIDLSRTRYQEAQRTNELEAVLDQISEPVTVYDAKRRVISMSRVAKRMYGIPEELNLTETPFSLDDLDMGSMKYRGVPSIDPPSERALAGEVVRDFEFAFIRLDTGEERLLLVDAVPIMEDGVVTAVVAVERDITEQRAAEAKERLHREQLERALQRTRAIADVSLALNAGADLHSVLRHAGRQVTHLMGGEIGGIGLQFDGESIIGMWTFGLETHPDEIMPVNMNAFPGTMRSFREGKPTLNTFDIASDEERRMMTAAGMRSSLITPFIVDGELVGAMYVKYPEDEPVLSDELIEFNTALAAQCVVAIRQTRLKEQLAAERSALNLAISELHLLTDELHRVRTLGSLDRGQSDDIGRILDLIQGTVSQIR